LPTLQNSLSFVHFLVIAFEIHSLKLKWTIIFFVFNHYICIDRKYIQLKKYFVHQCHEKTVCAFAWRKITYVHIQWMWHTYLHIQCFVFYLNVTYVCISLSFIWMCWKERWMLISQRQAVWSWCMSSLSRIVLLETDFVVWLNHARTRLPTYLHMLSYEHTWKKRDDNLRKSYDSLTYNYNACVALWQSVFFNRRKYVDLFSKRIRLLLLVL
jgi:hypothetical protein